MNAIRAVFDEMDADGEMTLDVHEMALFYRYCFQVTQPRWLKRAALAGAVAAAAAAAAAAAHRKRSSRSRLGPFPRTLFQPARFSLLRPGIFFLNLSQSLFDVELSADEVIGLFHLMVRPPQLAVMTTRPAP